MEDKLEIYYNFLIEENKKYNLTRITSKKDVREKHFNDSLEVFKAVEFRDGSSVADLGSGAGFPGVLLKLKNPKLKVSLIEATTKKCHFLEMLIDKLKLSGINVLNKRIEEIEEREIFDIVVSRALSDVRTVLELSSGIIKTNGQVVLYKGPSYLEELEEAEAAIKKLGYKLTKVHEYTLLDNELKRYLLVFKKNKETPSIYPRRYSNIKKQPL